MEGHFIRGYGDSQEPDADIDLLPGSVEAADKFLESHEESLKRLERVSDLIAGFETPYGMELLSTVHWVLHHQQPPATDEATATKAVQDWNPRKKQIFKPKHVQVAWNRLQSEGLL